MLSMAEHGSSATFETKSSTTFETGLLKYQERDEKEPS